MTDPARVAALKAQQAKLLTVKEYAYVVRVNPQTIYRRIWSGRQRGVHYDGRAIRLNPPDTV